jgi:hypothetical protein
MRGHKKSKSPDELFTSSWSDDQSDPEEEKGGGSDLRLLVHHTAVSPWKIPWARKKIEYKKNPSMSI